MNQNELLQRLKAPFAFSEIDWKIQTTTQDKTRGMAVPYVDSRAIQSRLDEVCGVFGWRNHYEKWHEQSQICGIAIFCEERKEWICKYDGAENADIEPTKSGLTNAFKRAAVLWGIGRFLYSLDSIWVDIEAKGKSSVIKQNQYGKLEVAYNAAVSKIFGSSAPSGNQTATPSENAGQSLSSNNNTNNQQPPVAAIFEYKVHSIKPSGKSSQLLELIDNNGEVVTAYIKASDQSITAGSRLHKVQMEKKESSYGPYNLINTYQLAA